VSGCQERRRSAGEIVEKNRDLFGAVTGKDLSEEPPSRLDNCVDVQVELGHELDGDPSAISVGSNAPYVTGTLQPIDQRVVAPVVSPVRCTLVRREGGDWQVAAFHNTARQSIKERMSFRLAPETMPAALRRAD
jgi:hypothetical protein